MKSRFLAAAILVLAAAGTVCAQQTVSSKITEATVFFNQARVCRQASADVNAGSQRLLIPIDEFSIDPNSVTAEVAGKGEILGVQVAKTPVAEPVQKKIREFEKQLKKLLSEKRALQDEKQALSRQQEFLESVVDFSGDRVSQKMKTQMPSTEDLDSVLDFLGSRFSQILKQKRAADEKLEQVNEKIEKIKRELNMLRGRKDKTATAIEIMFRSQKAQNIEIETRYMARNAGWSPVYRAMAADAESGINLSMMAEITQKTGGDWKDITLTVSSMVPVRGGRLPGLSPWRLDVPRKLLQKEAKSGARTRQFAAEAPGKKDRAEMAEAEKHTTPISFEYTMPEPVTVASRQQKTMLPVLTRSVDGKFYYHSVPAKDSRAYLVCEAEADSELLAGPVSIFFAGRYVGEMSLEEKKPGQSFVLGLGADRSVAVKRKKVRDFREETKFFGQVERDTVIREIKYQITAENLKDRPVKLRILDSVPVSATDRIKVEDIALAPEPEKKDVNGKTGVMRWDLELDPGQTSQITISFTVKYPKDIPPPAF